MTVSGRYIPSTVSEIKDHLSVMILRLPDKPMPVTGEGMDEAYADLELRWNYGDRCENP